MSENDFNRRDFLKVLGWGGAAATLSGCGFTSIQNGKETVTSYVHPPDWEIPGVANFYNSTCTQCEAYCNVKLRVREGRALKAEGNADSPVNRGNMCGLGQAGIQAHYNPDRVRAPMLNGQEVSWDDAMKALASKMNGVKGEEVAFVTGTTSGHTRALLEDYMDALGTKNHFAYEAIGPAVLRAANKKAYGTAMPRYRIDKARVVVSFGADFLGAWISPVHFSLMYARFRKGTRSGGRGILVQIEPKMSLTGANADRWLGIRPGTEGVMAMGLINALGAAGVHVPADIAAAAKDYTPERVGTDTGIAFDQINKLASLLKSHSPSLVLAGTAAEGYVHGMQNAVAISMLNYVLGNVGKTIEPSAGFPIAKFTPKIGNRASLKALNDGLAAGKYKVLFSYATNPVYSAPGSMKFGDNYKKAGFKVALTHYLDETAKAADLVLPLDSAMEEWTTVVPQYMPALMDKEDNSYTQLSFLQPTMRKLYAEGKDGKGTRSINDVLISLLAPRKAEYKDAKDAYTYLHADVIKKKAALGGSGDDDTYWYNTVSANIIPLKGAAEHLAPRISAAGLALPAPESADPSYPLRLIPHVTNNIRDGRNANEPWLQEAAEPLTTIVWDSWVEIHPSTADKLGVVEGDIVEVTSKSGSLKTQIYVTPAIHPDAVSIPLGYGHSSMGRYANNTGANAFSILDPIYDKDTGELALNETNVKISKTGDRVIVVKDEGFAGPSQGGVKKVSVEVSAQQVDLSKEI